MIVPADIKYRIDALRTTAEQEGFDIPDWQPADYPIDGIHVWRARHHGEEYEVGIVTATHDEKTRIGIRKRGGDGLLIIPVKEDAAAIDHVTVSLAVPAIAFKWHRSDVTRELHADITRRGIDIVEEREIETLTINDGIHPDDVRRLMCITYALSDSPLEWESLNSGTGMNGWKTTDDNLIFTMFVSESDPMSCLLYAQPGDDVLRGVESGNFSTTLKLVGEALQNPRTLLNKSKNYEQYNEVTIPIETLRSDSDDASGDTAPADD